MNTNTIQALESIASQIQQIDEYIEWGISISKSLDANQCAHIRKQIALVTDQLNQMRNTI